MHVCSLPDRRLTFGIRAVAGALALLSGTVMAAWIAHWPTVLRIHPSFPAMPFNSALLFGVCAAGLYAGASHRFRLQTLWGATLLVIAVPTALQFVLARDLGVDRLFLNPFLTSSGWPPGRMTPNSATAFTLIGLTFFAATNPRIRSVTAGIAAFPLLAMAGFALVERAFGGDGWTSSLGLFAGMAVHSAAGILGCGAALLCLGWRESERCGQLPTWLPYATAASVGVATTLLGGTLVIAFPDEAGPLVFATTAALGGALAALTGVSVRYMQLARERATQSEVVADALRQSEERLKLTLDNARHGLWDWDVRSGDLVLDANWWAILGYRPDEERPRFEFWAENMHPDDHGRVLEILDQSLRSDAVLYDVEYRARRKDGEWIWVNTRGRVQRREADGSPLRMMGTTHDITERKRAQQALDKQEERYRQIVDAAQDIIYRTDAEGRFTFANAAAARVLEASAEDLAGCHYLSLIRPDARDAAREFYERQTAERLTNTYFEFPVITSKGAEIWLGQNVQPLIEDGRARGFQGVARDITERKRMESELQQARDEALDSARLKSEFLANMSHEIRTPMNGVIGLTDLLLDTPLTGEQRNYVDGIRTSGDALLTLISDILDFSKIEAGMLQIDSIDFDLRTTLDNTLQLFVESGRRKHIELAALMYDDVPSAVCGDPGRLRQVLTNLLGNAVKFTDSGEVVVRVSTQVERASEVVIKCEVRDTGIGIAPHLVTRLFQAFVQADGSITRQFGGTGLGLAISKRLVELMGGAIGVESTPGVGSAFWFTVPLGKRRPVEVIDPDACDLRGRRALVVDDNATNRTVLTHYLRAWGLAAAEAADGTHALGLLRDASAERKPYDVAILDLMMPGMDGFALARAIKADASTRSVRLILMPSSGRRGHGRDARDAGIAAYLPKPVRQTELRACLAAVVADDAYAGAAGVQPASADKLITRHTLDESRALSERLLVLVVEDNALNQEVTRGQLEKLGFRVDVAGDGAGALQALERRRYAAVLMDCQMPGIDGFAATAEIRRREGTTWHTPVVALTAHAMQGERERCLHAGMDDYLAKPVRRHELAEVLARWTGGPAARSGAATCMAGAATAQAGGVNDPATIAGAIDLAMLDDVRREVGTELLASFVDALLSEVPPAIERVRQCTDLGSFAALEHEAHRLKGSCRTLGFEGMAAVWDQVETQARASIGQDLAACADRLDDERRLLLIWWEESATRTS